MKRFFITLALFAGALLDSGRAAAVATQIGDLILAFREKDNSVSLNLEIDLGPASAFLSLAPGTLLNLDFNGSFYGANGGLAAQDLRNVYGSGGTDNSAWNSSPNLAFNVFGTTGPGGGNTLYLTAPNGSILPRSSFSGQQGVVGRIDTVSAALNGTTSLTSPEAGTVDSSSPSFSGGSYSYNYRGGNPGTLTKDWNQYSLVTETSVVSSGTATAGLYVLNTGSGAGVEVGQFSLDSSGNLSYLSAVPEPSSAMLLGVTGAWLMAARWRRAARKI